MFSFRAKGIFKLNPIQAPVIYQICWIHWISNPFTENSNVKNDYQTNRSFGDKQPCKQQ